MNNSENPIHDQHGSAEIHISNLSECYFCRTSLLNDSIVYCPSCGFPQRGKEDEQKQFIFDKRLELIRQENLESSIKKTRWSIVAIALLYALNYLLIGIETREIIYASIEAVIVCGIFIVFAVLANKNPFLAIICSAGLFLTILIMYAVINPYTIFAGIIWKLIIMSALIFGIIEGNNAKNLKSTIERKNNFGF